MKLRTFIFLAVLMLCLVGFVSYPASVGAISGDAPTDFTATYVNDQEVDLSWVLNPTWGDVMIRFAYGRQPTQPTEGFLVYQGSLTTFTDTSLDLNRNIADAYYSAFSMKPDLTLSTDYAMAEVENPAMTEIATSINGFTTSITEYLGMGFLFVLALALVALAVTKKNPIYYVFASLFLMYLSLKWLAVPKWFDLGLAAFAIAFVIIMAGLYEAIFNSGRKSKGSQ